MPIRAEQEVTFFSSCHYRSSPGIDPSTLVSHGPREKPWLFSSVSVQALPLRSTLRSISCRSLTIDLYFIFAGFHLAFSTYMAVGIPCESCPPSRDISASKAHLSNRLRRSHQHHRHALARSYPCWSLWCHFLCRMDFPGWRWWIAIQEGMGL